MSIRILIVGTGMMAHHHTEAFEAMEDVEVVGGVDRDADTLSEFCRQHGLSQSFTSVEAAVAWGQFDAASNVTPDRVHHATTLPLLDARKHVLCEKPLATNHGDARDMVVRAEDAGVINMVNLTYRRSGALTTASELIRDGAIGEVRHFEASYLQDWLNLPGWSEEPFFLWRLSTAHGSTGTLGDLGVHILDYATFAAGASPASISCRLATFEKAPGRSVGDYVFDANDSFTMHLQLDNGATGVIHSSRFASGHHNDLLLSLHGTRGALQVSDIDGREQLRGCLGNDVGSRTWADIPFRPAPTNFEKFVAAIRSGRSGEPDFARGADLQKVLDLAVQSSDQACRSIDVAT